MVPQSGKLKNSKLPLSEYDAIQIVVAKAGIALVFAFAAVIGLVISDTAHAETGLPLSAKLSGAIERALDTEATNLGYKVKFKVQKCASDVKYVCDVIGKSGPYQVKFLVAADGEGKPLTHFSLPMDGTHTPLMLASYSVVTSLIGNLDSDFKTMSDFLNDEIGQAKSNDGVAEDPFRDFAFTVPEGVSDILCQILVTPH